MKAKVVTLENKAAGDIELSDAVFGLDPRKDILHRVVEYQRAKRRAGTHSVKTRAEVSGTTAKPFKQKGTGNARQGTRVGPHQIGGGKAHGPVVRSHAFKLPKKIRALGMKMALSAKQKAGLLTIVDSLELQAAATKTLVAQCKALGLEKPLFVAGAEVNLPFAQSARNIKGADVLPVQGANVYDILRHRELVLSKEAVEALQQRLA
jgi:large subunit ribosomal protein L4